MSGAYPCGCRDCFDVAIGEAGYRKGAMVPRCVEVEA